MQMNEPIGKTPLDDQPNGVTAQLALIWRQAPGPALRELIGHCRRAFTTAP